MLNRLKSLLGNKKEPTSSSQPGIENGDNVEIFNKAGQRIKKADMGDKEKRMQEVLDTISKAGKTGKYMIGISIHDPHNKLKRKGGDIHHFAFQQDFPTEDRYGCLDEFAKLMGLGDK